MRYLHTLDGLDAQALVAYHNEPPIEDEGVVKYEYELCSTPVVSVRKNVRQNNRGYDQNRV